MVMNRKDIELRDWYFGLAMQSLIIDYEGIYNPESLAIDAFEMAEAMMDRRQKEMDAEINAIMASETE
jgi:hypothetical protein